MPTILASLSAVNLRTARWRAAAAKSYPGRDRTGIEKVDPQRLSILPTSPSKDRPFYPYGVNTSRETAECSLIYAYTRGDVKKSINQALKPRARARISWEEFLILHQEHRFSSVSLSLSIKHTTFWRPDYFSHARIFFIAMRANNWLTNNASDQVHFNHFAVAIDYSPPFLRGSDDENQLSVLSLLTSPFPTRGERALFYPPGDLSAITTPRVSPRDLFCERWRERKEPYPTVYFFASHMPYVLRNAVWRAQDKWPAFFRDCTCVCA